MLYKLLIPLLFIFSCTISKQRSSTGKDLKSSKPLRLFHSGMKQGVACYRIPALITAANGDLIAAVDERHNNCGDLRSNDDINIVIRRSLDHGKTWLDLETIVDYPSGESASDPSFILDQTTETLFLFYNYMNLKDAPNIYSFKMIQSKDHGQSWSKPLDITRQVTPEDWYQDFKFITSGRGIQTRDGTLLHTIVNLQKGLHLFASKNHGKDWYLINTPIRPGDESKVVELPDGSWMINSRVNKAGLRYVHLSRDQGKTWSTQADSTLIDPACNASLLLYPTTKNKAANYLIFSNVNSATARKNLSVRLSEDAGQTWQAPKTIYPGKAAYSSMDILKNEKIGLLFEKDDYQEIAFVQFPMSWLAK